MKVTDPRVIICSSLSEYRSQRHGQAQILLFCLTASKVCGLWFKSTTACCYLLFLLHFNQTLTMDNHVNLIIFSFCPCWTAMLDSWYKVFVRCWGSYEVLLLNVVLCIRTISPLMSNQSKGNVSKSVVVCSSCHAVLFRGNNFVLANLPNKQYLFSSLVIALDVYSEM